ncbi:MAG: hypothetical protein EOO61_20945 [Hymenobacter sp.]|nr:MAG: hypothetical protein EOO61_20945 [Hymenobacter sp.]
MSTFEYKDVTPKPKQKMTSAQALTIFGLVVPTMIIRGFVFSILWGWFVVPLGVVAIGVAHAIGLAAVFGFLTTHLSHYQRKESDNPFGEALGRMLVVPFLVLFFAWIVHLFM